MYSEQPNGTTSTLIYSAQVTKENRLFQAIAENKIEAVRILADETTSNAINEQGLTPLGMLITQSEHITPHETHALVEMGRALISAGAEVNYPHKQSKKTALHVAAEYGCLPLCELLVSHGGNIEAKDSFGATPIISAASFKRTSDVIDYLAQQHANVNAQTYAHMKGVAGGKMTALHFAFNENQINNILSLVEKGAALDAVSDCGATVLECMHMDLFGFFELDPQLCHTFAAILKSRRTLSAEKNHSTDNEGSSVILNSYEKELGELLQKHNRAIANAYHIVQEKIIAMIKEKALAEIRSTLLKINCFT